MLRGRQGAPVRCGGDPQGPELRVLAKAKRRSPKAEKLVVGEMETLPNPKKRRSEKAKGVAGEVDTQPLPQKLKS